MNNSINCSNIIKKDFSTHLLHVNEGLMRNIPIPEFNYGQNPKQGFFKQVVMELWVFETTKWAVGNLYLGSCKLN